MSISSLLVNNYEVVPIDQPSLDHPLLAVFIVSIILLQNHTYNHLFTI